MHGTSSWPSGSFSRRHRADPRRRRPPRCRHRARVAARLSSQIGRCARTAGARETRRLDVSAFHASALALHDFHEAVRIEDLELSVRERHPEFIPGDDFDPVVPTFRELNPVGSPDAAGPEPRVTGPMLVQALTAGVLSSGAPAIDAGLVSTPTLARGAREFACGAVVTASHNPSPYNGIKLWNPDGMAFDEDQQREIEEALDRARPAVPSWDHVGLVSSRPDLVEQHVEAILRDLGTAKLRVVVDCACGATSTITPFLLRQMGCDVIAINAQADGHFPGRDPEPLEEHLAALPSTVRAVHADLGIAHDRDGDRMVAVDRDGRFVGGHARLAVFRREDLRRGLRLSLPASIVL